MSHNDYIRPGGQWPGEIVPGAEDYRRFDNRQSKLVNGDGGGNWNPTSPIIIGGAGVVLSTTGSLLNGGVSTATGGRVVVVGVSGNNTPQFTQAGTDKIIVPVVNLTAPMADTTNTSFLPDDYTTPMTSPGVVGIQAGATSTEMVLEIPPRYLHQGASFTTFVMRFRVLAKPTSLPASPLQFVPFGWNAAGTAIGSTAPNPNAVPPWFAGYGPLTAGVSYVTPQLGALTGYYYKCTNAGSGTTGPTPSAWTTTIGASTVADGHGVIWTCWGRSGQLPSTTDAAAYYNNGLPQALYYDMDNTVLSANAIDTTGWHYGFAIAGMSDYGSGPSNSLLNLVVHSFEIDVSNIVDFRFE